MLGSLFVSPARADFDITNTEDVGDPTTSSGYQRCFYTIAGPAESTALLVHSTG